VDHKQLLSAVRSLQAAHPITSCSLDEVPFLGPFFEVSQPSEELLTLRGANSSQLTAQINQEMISRFPLLKGRPLLIPIASSAGKEAGDFVGIAVHRSIADAGSFATICKLFAHHIEQNIPSSIISTSMVMNNTDQVLLPTEIVGPFAGFSMMRYILSHLSHASLFQSTSSSAASATSLEHAEIDLEALESFCRRHSITVQSLIEAACVKALGDLEKKEKVSWSVSVDLRASLEFDDSSSSSTGGDRILQNALGSFSRNLRGFSTARTAITDSAAGGDIDAAALIQSAQDLIVQQTLKLNRGDHFRDGQSSVLRIVGQWTDIHFEAVEAPSDPSPTTLLERLHSCHAMQHAARHVDCIYFGSSRVVLYSSTAATLPSLLQPVTHIISKVISK
jgi:hypothetical protein